jgi:hypothetical protein
MQVTSPGVSIIKQLRADLFSHAFLLILVFFAAPLSAWAQPDNDFFANSRLIRGTAGTNTVIFVDATKEPAEPTPPFQNSVWYTWNSPGKGTLLTYLNESWGGANIFTGNSVSTLQRVGFNFAFVEPSSSYHIALETQQPFEPLTFCYKYWPALTNDLFTKSIPLTGIAPRVQSLFAQYNYDTNEPVSELFGSPGQHVPIAWWTWTAPETGIGRIVAHLPNFGARVYSGNTLTNLTLLATSSYSFPGTNTMFGAQAGAKYHIAVSAPLINELDFSLHLDPPLTVHGLPPSGLIPHTNLSLLSFSGVPPGETVTNFAVIFPQTANPLTGTILFELFIPRFAAGTHYVTAFAETLSGRRYTLPPTSFTITHPNDNFASRITLSGTYAEFDVDVYSATVEPAEPDTAPRSAWWTWTAPANGRLRIERLSGSAAVQIYTNSTLPTLEPLVGDRVVAGQTCQLRGIPSGFLSPNEGTFALIFYPDPAPNDNFSQRIVINGTAYDGWLHGGTGTGEPGEEFALPSFWYTYTAPADGVIEFGGTGFDGVWHPFFSSFLYQGESLDALTSIQPIFATGRFPVREGQTYQLCVRDVHSQSTGRFRFRFLQPPPNDHFAASTILTGDRLYFSGRLDTATTEPSEPAILNGSNPAVSIWFRWTAPSNGWATVSPLNSPEFSSPLPAFDIFTDTGTNLLNYIPPIPFDGHTVIFPIQAGTTYFLRLSYQSAPVPSDTFAYSLQIHDAVVISPAFGSTHTFPDVPILSATASGADLPGATMHYYKQVGYDFGPRGILPIIQHIGSSTAAPNFPFVATELLPGDHFVHAALVTSDSRTNYSFPVFFSVRPANDNFTNAIPIHGRHLEVAGIADRATLEPGEPPRQYPGLTRSVWYTWTAEVDGPVLLKVQGRGLFIHALTGAAVDALTQVSVMDQFDTWHRFNAVKSQTYKIAIVGGDFEQLQFTFTLNQETVSPPPQFPTVFNSTSPIPLDLLTTEPPGTVLKTEYFLSSNLIATAPNGTAAQWTNSTPGYYNLTAIVYLSSGEIISNSFPTIRVRPHNNSYDEAQELFGADVLFDNNLLGGDEELGSTSIWYRWRAPADGTLALSTTNGPFWGGIFIYSGDTFAQRTPVPTHGMPEWTGWTTAPVQADTVYHIQIGYYPSILPSLRLRFFENNPDTNTSSGQAEPFTGGTLHRDIFTGSLNVMSKLWWTWQLPTAGIMKWNGTGAFVLHEVGGDGSLVPIFPERIQANKHYYLSMEANALITSIELNFTPAPANDNFADRILLTGSRVRFSASLEAATSEPFNDNPGAWWEWVAPQTSSVLIRCLPGQELVALKIHPDGTWPHLSYFDEAVGQVRFNAIQGHRYFLRAGASSGGETHMELISEIPPFNDNFSSATVIPGTSVGQPSANNWGARREHNEPIHPSGYGGRSVWYAWTAPTNGQHAVRVEINGDLGETLLAVFQGTSVSHLTTIAHNAGHNSVHSAFVAEPGQKYYIRVEGLMGNTGDFSLRLNSAPLIDTDLVLYQPKLEGGTFSFRVTEIDPWVVTVEASDNLADWYEVPYSTHDPSSTIFLPGEPGARFFRATKGLGVFYPPPPPAP